MRRGPSIVPSWTKTISSMIEAHGPGCNVEVRCSLCAGFKKLAKEDLERIGAAKGMDYSLWNKRTRCRLTPGCRGWNTFRFEHGPWAYGLFDDKQIGRWMDADMR
jgi:hypothetical protein